MTHPFENSQKDPKSCTNNTTVAMPHIVKKTVVALEEDKQMDTNGLVQLVLSELRNVIDKSHENNAELLSQAQQNTNKMMEQMQQYMLAQQQSQTQMFQQILAVNNQQFQQQQMHLVSSFSNMATNLFRQQHQQQLQHPGSIDRHHHHQQQLTYPHQQPAVAGRKRLLLAANETDSISSSYSLSDDLDSSDDFSMQPLAKRRKQSRPYVAIPTSAELSAMYDNCERYIDNRIIWLIWMLGGFCVMMNTGERSKRIAYCVSNELDPDDRPSKPPYTELLEREFSHLDREPSGTVVLPDENATMDIKVVRPRSSTYSAASASTSPSQSLHGSVADYSPKDILDLEESGFMHSNFFPTPGPSLYRIKKLQKSYKSCDHVDVVYCLGTIRLFLKYFSVPAWKNLSEEKILQHLVNYINLKLNAIHLFLESDSALYGVIENEVELAERPPEELEEDFVVGQFKYTWSYSRRDRQAVRKYFSHCMPQDASSSSSMGARGGKSGRGGGGGNNGRNGKKEKSRPYKVLALDDLMRLLAIDIDNNDFIYIDRICSSVSGGEEDGIEEDNQGLSSDQQDVAVAVIRQYQPTIQLVPKDTFEASMSSHKKHPITVFHQLALCKSANEISSSSSRAGGSDPSNIGNQRLSILLHSVFFDVIQPYVDKKMMLLNMHSSSSSSSSSSPEYDDHPPFMYASSSIAPNSTNGFASSNHYNNNPDSMYLTNTVVSPSSSSSIVGNDSSISSSSSINNTSSLVCEEDDLFLKKFLDVTDDPLKPLVLL